MINGISTAATALTSAELRHAVTSRNLANAHVPGFRRELVTNSTWEAPRPQRGATREQFGTTTETVVVDHTPGPLQVTERPLDVAINGDGFFVVEGPDGPLYTRNGAFTVSPEGELVTAAGLPVATENGTLTIPPETVLDSLQISANGTISAAGQELGKLKVVRFDDPARLVSAGGTLFSADDGNPPLDFAPRLIQGSLERANFSPVDELVQLIVASRAYEAAQRTLRTIDESVQNRIDLQRT